MTLDYILQLGLNRLRKTDSRDPAVQVAWLIDQILEVVTENLSDEDSDGVSFRSKLESLRREILDGEKGEVSKLTAVTTLDLCKGQFKKTQSKWLERDAYFAEIILFLRNALANLTGDTQTFHNDLMGTTDRIREIIKVENIRELRTRITNEVNQLKTMVTEKQINYKTQITQLSEKITVLQQKLEEAKAEASIDGLTGVANRRSFDFTIQRWVIGYEKNESPFTVAIIDLDNFKQINDTYGHQAGDQVLAETAAVLGKNIRGDDFLARYGGEEFIVLVSGLKLAESEKRFSELLKQIESRQFGCRKTGLGEVPISVTASCGIAEYAFGENARDLISRADEALYEAKRAGKNRVFAKRRSLLSAFYEGRKRNSTA
jgi:diguanylate cyclase (GGDEF)-like protein